jgi:dihydrodipicolinate synthase/N-acetylneuraminate lyase
MKPKFPLAHAISKDTAHTGGLFASSSSSSDTDALKHAFVERGILDHATVRSPLLPLEPGAEHDIFAAMRSAGMSKVHVAAQVEVAHA